MKSEKLTTQTKTGTARAVMLPPSIVVAMRAHVDEHRPRASARRHCSRDREVEPLTRTQLQQRLEERYVGGRAATVPPARHPTRRSDDSGSGGRDDA